jgi:hypothetical protein
MWPIDYRCGWCGKVSEILAEEIQPEGVGIPDQKLHAEILLHCEFLSGQESSERRYWTYTKRLPNGVKEPELIQMLLLPTGKWKPEYGEPHFVRTDLVPY